MGPLRTRKTVSPSIHWTLGWPCDKHQAEQQAWCQLGILGKCFFPNMCAAALSLSPLTVSSGLKCVCGAGGGAGACYKHKFPSCLGGSLLFFLLLNFISLFFLAVSCHWERGGGREKEREEGRGGERKGEGGEEREEGFLESASVVFDLSLYISFHFKFPPSSARIS